MNQNTLLADPAAIEIDSFVSGDDSILIRVHSTQIEACCPSCKKPSHSLKCRYIRHVADLPWHNVAIRLELNVRKFRCRNELCKQKVFCERLPRVVSVYGRRTVRLSDAITFLAFVLGGRAGSRATRKLNFSFCKDTLLRAIRRTGSSDGGNQKPFVKILGVDDFAFRKGNTYGTILVDLEKHRVIDLLADREAETLKSWLEQHPEVEVISRDRAPAYRDGARRGAPQAVQVADRFHLLKNIIEALENFLGRKYSLLKQTHRIIKDKYSTTAVPPETEIKNDELQSEKPPNPKREIRLERFQKVKELQKKNYPILAISRILKMHRRTVRLFMKSEEMPERKIPIRRHSLTPFIRYLEKRWSEGERNATKLWNELREQGFRGCSSSVIHFLTRWREPIPEEARLKNSKPANGISRQPPSPRQTGWMLFNPEFCKRQWQLEYTEQLCQNNEEISAAKELVGKFYQLLKNGTAEGLKEWLQNATESGIREFQSFAGGIEKDLAAVEAAIEMIWSNGQVEGSVNRLKTIKRAMYGRAKFDLLKAKVLYQN